MEYLFFYGLQLANCLEVVCATTFFLLVVLLITIVIYALTHKHIFDKEDKYYPEDLVCFTKLKKWAVVLFCIWLPLCFIPEKQTLLYMGGTYIGKHTVFKSERMQKLEKLIDLEIDKQLKELEVK